MRKSRDAAAIINIAARKQPWLWRDRSSQDWSVPSWKFSPATRGAGSSRSSPSRTSRPNRSEYAISLGGNAQAARFSKRRASLFSHRHLAGFGNNLHRPVIPNAAIELIFCILFRGPLPIGQGAKRHAKCFRSDHYDVNVLALWTLKCSQSEAHTCRRYAGEHHVRIAFRAGGPLKVERWHARAGNRISAWRFPHKAGAQHSQSPLVCLCRSNSDGASIDHRIPGRLFHSDQCSARLCELLNMTLQQPSGF